MAFPLTNPLPPLKVRLSEGKETFGIERNISAFFGNKRRAFIASVLGMMLVYGIEPLLIAVAPLAIMLLLFVTYPGSDIIGSDGVQELGETGGMLIILVIIADLLSIFI